MRILLFFDLPTLESEDLKEYRHFRKFLISNGFIMLQKSCYVKMLLNSTSLDNFLSKKSKNGVTTNIRVIHHSTGDSNNQEWINNRNKMLKKYKTVLPIINLQYEIKDL